MTLPSDCGDPDLVWRSKYIKQLNSVDRSRNRSQLLNIRRSWLRKRPKSATAVGLNGTGVPPFGYASQTLQSKRVHSPRDTKNTLATLRRDFFGLPDKTLHRLLKKLEKNTLPVYQNLASRLRELATNRESLGDFCTRHPHLQPVVTDLKNLLVGGPETVDTTRDSLLGALRNKDQRLLVLECLSKLQVELPQLYAMEGEWFAYARKSGRRSLAFGPNPILAPAILTKLFIAAYVVLFIVCVAFAIAGRSRSIRTYPTRGKFKAQFTLYVQVDSKIHALFSSTERSVLY